MRPDMDFTITVSGAVTESEHKWSAGTLEVRDRHRGIQLCVWLANCDRSPKMHLKTKRETGPVWLHRKETNLPVTVSLHCDGGVVRVGVWFAGGCCCLSLLPLALSSHTVAGSLQTTEALTLEVVGVLSAQQAESLAVILINFVSLGKIPLNWASYFFFLFSNTPWKRFISSLHKDSDSQSRFYVILFCANTVC